MSRSVARRTRSLRFAALARVSALATIVLAVAATGCGGPQAGARGGGGPPPVPVDVAPVVSQPVQERFEALGTLDAEENVQIVSEITGAVRSLTFAEGQPVARGTVLARMDDREIRAEVARAAAVVQQARANFKRIETLHERGSASQQELERFGTDLRVAEASANLSRTRLDKTRIRAPFSGVVGHRRVSTGAYLQAGDVITDLARLDLMKVSFNVPERFASSLRVGTPVQVVSAAYPANVFEGQVSVVDPQVNAESRTLRLIARVANPSRQLRPGMSANVRVILAHRASALVVPDEAVFAQGNQSFVYVVKPDSTVARTAVVLGSRDSAVVEVVQGVGPTDRVVRAGHQKLFDGARIMPVVAGPQGATSARP